jgi:adenylate cyclase
MAGDKSIDTTISQLPADPGRPATVLFADVSESTKLYETAGDAIAQAAIGRCIEAMKRAVEAAGGRVVKTIGDEVMAIFRMPDAAAAAAAEMQGAVDLMPIVAGAKLALRIGFHGGPVIQKDNDVFGDTVNLAARLVATAVKGQIITSTDTSDLLNPMIRSSMRELYKIQVKGKAGEVGLCEMVWRRTDEDTTVFASGRMQARPSTSVLRLKYRGKETARRRDSDAVDIGRDNDCGVMIADHMASRRHCTIERRQDKWVLRDHSTNGTFVTVEGDTELLLRREELTLRKHGWIACGQSRAGTEEVVEFFVD